MTRTAFALLCVGLICTAVAGAIFPLVALGEFGPVLFPIGFLLSLVGFLLKPRDGGSSARSPIFLGILGLLLLAPAAFYGGGLGYAVDIHRIRPGIVERSATPREWAEAAALAGLSAMCLTEAVRRRAVLSKSRTLIWAATMLAAPALAFALFLVLDRVFPLID